MHRRTGLILALDMDYETPALELLADVYTYVDAAEIGYQLILSEGLPGTLDSCRAQVAQGLPIFLIPL